MLPNTENQPNTTWNTIVKEHEEQRPPFSPHEGTDGPRHPPEFCGYLHKRPSSTDVGGSPRPHDPLHDSQDDSQEDSLSRRCSEICAGVKPDRLSSDPREYLEGLVFPVLLPGLEAMLEKAVEEKCLERRRTKFNACDFLTEYLYRHNPDHEDRGEMSLCDIPFVQQHLQNNPRPPIPPSLLWSEEQASLIIQSYFRGFKVRREAEVQELREWQRDWRERGRDVRQAVEQLWGEESKQTTPTCP